MEASFYEMLAKFDEDLAEKARLAGCRCGGPLHLSRYPRKPRGATVELGAAYEWRWSYCCGREGCRRRMTPVSVRYMGRRVYLGCVFVLISAMMNGLSPRRVARLQEGLGLGQRTLRRWRRWWREGFVRTRLWRAERGRLSPAVEEGELPRALVERFGEPGGEALLAALRFLSPLTSTSADGI